MKATPHWRWPRVLAHRCGGRLAPENSLRGLELAHGAGVRGVEFDVMLAACGTPVLMHDETLERTTNGAGRVADTPIHTLAALRLRDVQGRLTDDRVPTFAEALQHCARLGLAANVEIKPTTGQERETGAVVGQVASAHYVAGETPPLLSSFSIAALEAAAQTAPAFARALLLDTVPQNAIQTALDLGCVALVVNVRRLDGALIDAAHAASLGIACYTENDPARGAAWLARGLDALITDRPDCLGPVDIQIAAAPGLQGVQR